MFTSGQNSGNNSNVRMADKSSKRWESYNIWEWE